MAGDTMRLAVRSQARVGFIRLQLPRLSEWLSRMAHCTVRIQLEEPDDLEQAQGPSPRGHHGPSQQEKTQAMNMPLTHRVAELFDATLMDLRDEQANDNAEKEPPV